MQLPAHTDISDSFHQSKVPAFGLINSQLSRVKELVKKQLAGCPDEIGTRHLFANFRSRSGKMLRPGLVLLAGAACGKITDKHIRVAAIVELIHNATLLHDDVIDQGQKRRGQSTINSLYGNEPAVLLGDFLLSRVFRMCADLQPRLIAIIADTTARICEGELRQMMNSLCIKTNGYCAKQKRQYDISESEYIDIITEKSAVLFSTCCLLGVLLVEGGERYAQPLADFGLNTGIAFQITDDLLDLTGDEGKTGKTLGSDVAENKPTLSIIHLLTAVQKGEKAALVEKLCAKHSALNPNLMKMLRSYGSLEYARSRAQDFVKKAVASLSIMKKSEAKDALIQTAGFVANRTI